eukprot:TRINITY_DN3791_c0_g1_i2.p1 TRINITY_DN3791_c0_g1~~TRINITY_DN3791_c0_g1_i2.p1  ORF type:complete len:469 (-),score=51.82 TRINITY_DN3791_c0_g1_i2:132-1538(-)
MGYNLRKKVRLNESGSSSLRSLKVHEPLESHSDASEKIDKTGKGKRTASDLGSKMQLRSINQQGMQRIVSGEPAICQLLQATDFFFRLPRKSVFALTLTSKSISQQLTPLISVHYTFFYREPRPLTHYYPRSLFIVAPNVKELFNTPNFSRLHKIETSSEFDSPLPKIPDSVTHIYLHDRFNQRLHNNLPQSLIYLQVGRDFNQTLNNLPSTLKHLNMEKNAYFNRRVPSFPSNITQLSFGCFFSQCVDRLPQTLTHLSFGRNFDREVDCLPLSLTHLSFGAYFTQKVDCLPKSLTHLTFTGKFNQTINHLPPGLTHLVLSDDFNRAVDSLPSSITNLSFGYCFSQSVNYLPFNLTNLSFGYMFNLPLDYLPRKLTHITFSHTSTFNQPINRLPSTVTHIQLGHSFNQPLHLLPCNLTHLKLGDGFFQSLADLPLTIKHLFFAFEFSSRNSDLPKELRRSVKKKMWVV